MWPCPASEPLGLFPLPENDLQSLSSLTHPCHLLACVFWEHRCWREELRQWPKHSPWPSSSRKHQRTREQEARTACQQPPSQQSGPGWTTEETQRGFGLPTGHWGYHPILGKNLKPQRPTHLQTGLRLVHRANVCADHWHLSPHRMRGKCSQEHHSEGKKTKFNECPRRVMLLEKRKKEKLF